MAKRDDFNYKRYLASREWALLKQAVHKRARGTCERCPTSNAIAAVHHLTYERIGREELADLQAVCAGCHVYLSGHSDVDPVAEAVLAVIRDARAEAAICPPADAPTWTECAEQFEVELRDYEAMTPRPKSWRAFQWARQMESEDAA